MLVNVEPNVEYVAWALYATVMAAMIPFILRRVIVETFKCPEVQRLHVAPINDALDNRIPYLLGPAIIRMSGNSEALTAVAGILLDDKMQNAFGEATAESVRRKDYIKNYVILQSRLLKEPRIQAAMREIFVKAMNDKLMREATTLIIVESLVDSAVQKAIMSTLIQVLKRLNGPQGEKFAGVKQSCKQAITEVLNDEEISGALAEGSYSAIKTIVKTALMDPELVVIVRDIIKDVLSDEGIHKAHLHGAVNAMKPNVLKNSAEKIDEMRTTVNTFAGRVMKARWSLFVDKAIRSGEEGDAGSEADEAEMPSISPQSSCDSPK